MKFTDTPDQAALRAVVRDFLRQHVTVDRVRQAAADPAGYDAAVWKRLSGELGLTALPIPAQSGGAGATFTEVAVVLAEAGRVLVPVPYLSSSVVATVLSEAGSHELLPGLADGTLIGALALTGSASITDDALSGRARFVVDGPLADLFLVRAGDSLVTVSAADATVTRTGTLDQTRTQASVTFSAVPFTTVSADDGAALARRAEDLFRTALAVESVGAAEHCLDAIVAYLKDRVQFGRPIGSFQALKHRCADLAVEVESARATARAAVWTAVHEPAELAVVGPLAKRHCIDVFVHVTAEMIQLLGGIGFTWEHETHLYFKRAKSNQLLGGTPSELRRLIAERANLT